MHTQPKYCCIASSGGGGHNTAMLAILSELNPQSIPTYSPRPYTKNLTSLMRLAIFFACKIGLLPAYRHIMAAIDTLNTNTPRPYIDMLLDVCETGYETAAIWNVYQRDDRADQLQQLIRLQPSHDRLNYHSIYHYFLNILTHAFKAGTPYTQIICTQATGLSAVCDAVLAYNQRHQQQLTIQQYITDLPTPGAVHFFGPLRRLTPSQQGIMELFLVNSMSFPTAHAFLAIHCLDAQHNPMVRAGFYDRRYHFSHCLDQTVQISSHPPMVVNAQEKVAVIMLGSQASLDSAHYVLPLLQLAQMNKVVVLVGSNTQLRAKLTDWQAAHPELATQLVVLGPQADTAIAALMTRSNVVIIRSGGLSVMEQLAIPHPPQQLIILHQARGRQGSGIIWEDSNGDVLISALTPQGVQVIKTEPQSFISEYARAFV
jgi:effector protein SdbA